MRRQTWGLVDAVALAWVLELMFWIVLLARSSVLSRLHAEPDLWVLAIVVLAQLRSGSSGPFHRIVVLVASCLEPAASLGNVRMNSNDA